MNDSKQYGFVAPVITEDNYIFGASPLPQVILRPDGQWLDYTPDYEPQAKYFDTYNCTGFGTEHAWATILEEQFDVIRNFSARALGKFANTYPPGNDPHTVAEAGRKYGLAPEDLWPFSDLLKNVDEYYGILPSYVINESSKFLTEYKLGHDWVLEKDRDDWKERMIDALKLSPLGVAVDAWNKEGELYVRKGGDNHWTLCVGYVKDEYWIIWDTYDGGLKHLDWNYGFKYCKRYSVEKLEVEKKNALVNLKDWIKDSRVFAVLYAIFYSILITIIL